MGNGGRQLVPDHRDVWFMRTGFIRPRYGAPLMGTTRKASSPSFGGLQVTLSAMLSRPLNNTGGEVSVHRAQGFSHRV